MNDFIENLEEFSRVGMDIGTAARQINDLMVLYAELVGYVGYVSARYPAVDKEAMLHIESMAEDRRKREEEIDAA